VPLLGPQPVRATVIVLGQRPAIGACASVLAALSRSSASRGAAFFCAPFGDISGENRIADRNEDTPDIAGSAME
jgi:hypothetical protein